jgi:hypothetical protein
MTRGQGIALRDTHVIRFRPVSGLVVGLRSCSKIPQLAHYGVKNRLKCSFTPCKLRFLADFYLVLHSPE